METNIIDNFQWLLGIWKTRDGRSIYEEWWKKDENTLVGIRYELNHGEKQAQEKLNLAKHGDTVCYSIFDPQTRASHILQMNFFTEGMAVFENPAKTFPKFVRYKALAEGRLEVIADGIRMNGKSYRIQYPFVKVS